MISYFKPGDLVRSDRPNGQVPKEEQKRLGLVINHVPGYTNGNPYACTALLIAWFGPRVGNFLTIEVDHRVAHV